MYKLIIDAGNTNIKIYLALNGIIKESSVFSSEDDSISFIENISAKKCIVKGILSTVRNSPNDFFQKIVPLIDLILFDNELKLPIQITYETVNTLGRDRIAAICGASVLYPKKNVLVIDAGTAITYDILLKNGTYPGGNISLGLQTRFKALNTFTGKLPLVNINNNINCLFGTNTEMAITCGVQNGLMNEVKGIISDFNQRYDNLIVVFTGGDTFFFDKLIKNCIFAEPNLTAIGLNKILELNV